MPKFGEIIVDDFPPLARDAIHCAVISMIAGEDLTGGERVGFIKGSHRNDLAVTEGLCPDNVLGIVDPFLGDTFIVKEGQKFWMFLFPGSISGLQHRWQHPAFGEDTTPPDRQKAGDYLRKMSDSAGIGFLRFLEMIEQGGGLVDQSSPLCYSTLSSYDREQYEIYMGRPAPSEVDFHCAC